MKRHSPGKALRCGAQERGVYLHRNHSRVGLCAGEYDTFEYDTFLRQTLHQRRGSNARGRDKKTTGALREPVYLELEVGPRHLSDGGMIGQGAARQQDRGRLPQRLSEFTLQLLYSAAVAVVPGRPIGGSR